MVFLRGDRKETRTKIVCTIGPASRDSEMLRRLIREGMDVARINFSHGTLEEHQESIERIRRVAEEEESVVAVLGDLPGPKLRIGRLAAPLELEPGQWIAFSLEDADGSAHVIPLSHPELIAAARIGGRWLLDDGLIDVVVREVRPDAVIAQVLVGGTLSSRKGIHAPGVPLPAMTEADRDLARFGVSQDIDFLALSFVRSEEDLLDLRREIDGLPRGSSIGIVAKIERQEALENLDGILLSADGIMIARGDLGLEIPPQEVPARQKEIIRRCNRIGLPVITATQMLQSMIDKPRPTRAEASDVANAILDGTDAVMLSGETAVGRYPVRAVAMMREISEIAETTVVRSCDAAFEGGGEPDTRIAASVSAAAARIAGEIDARLIVTATASGTTARRVARQRPQHPILALTPDERVLHQLALVWGVTPLRIADVTGEGLVDAAASAVVEAGFAEQGDIIVVTAGLPLGGPGTTNTVRVHRIA